FLGYRAGYIDDGSGGQNTGVGSNALLNNVAGYYNVAVGSNALSSNDDGASNIAIGQQALNTNVSGTQNTAVGGSALINSTGNYNTALGFEAGSTTTGAENLFLGYKAGDNLTTGSYNILIGNEIDAVSATGDYQLNIGNILYGTTINGTGTTLSTGNLGVGTASPGARLEVKSQAGGSQVGLIVDNSTSTGNILEVKDNGSAVFTIADGGNVTAKGNILGSNSSTATTATTSGTGTNTTTLTFTGTTSFANNDIIFIDNAGQDYYTRIVSGGTAASVTVSPAVTFEATRTVTKYQNITNLGATSSDYTTQTQRLFQGYFLGGVVTGAGSTTLSDGILNSSTALALQIGGTTKLSVDSSGNTTAAGTLIVQGTGTAVTISGAATTALNISNTGVTTDISLQNGETIDNNTNGTVQVTATTTALSGNLTVSGTGSSTIGGTLTVSGTNIDIGVNDSGSGDRQLRIYGGGTGTSEGGQVTLYTSADYDTSIDSYVLDVYQDSFRIYTGGTVRFSIQSTGTADFAGDLTVSGGNLGIGTAANSSYVLYAYYDSDTYARFLNDDNGDFYIRGANADLYVQDSATSNSTRIHNNGTNGYIDVSGSTGDLYLRPASNMTRVVNLSSTNAIFGAYVSGSSINTSNSTGVSNTGACRSTTVDGFGAYQLGFCTSLQRYKDNTVNISFGLETLRQLRPVEFDWNIGASRHDIGFIAEEVQAVNPLLAEYADGQLTGVAYNLVGVLNTKSIQQLDVQVQSIDARLSVVESGNFSGNIHVASDAQIDGNLTVAGDTELNNLTVTGDTTVANLTVNGKIITTGNNTPTAVLGASTTGQGSTYTIEGNDTAGTITITTGTNTPTNPLASGEQVAVTFDESFTASPRIALTAKDAGSAEVRTYVETTVTGFKIHFLNVPTASTPYTFDYIIIQ
ncbi:tail fiber domain-containing protein, partial [Candidatus Saccharibacteria bacterium]|nr:tail fiber domain-containing protein [Candidatus Saccharibacteria bacterium]